MTVGENSNFSIEEKLFAERFHFEDVFPWLHVMYSTLIRFEGMCVGDRGGGGCAFPLDDKGFVTGKGVLKQQIRFNDETLPSGNKSQLQRMLITRALLIMLLLELTALLNILADYSKVSSA